jgi:hypothetical protein
MVEAMASDVPVIAQVVQGRNRERPGDRIYCRAKRWPAGEDGTSRTVPAPQKLHLGKNW